MRVRSVALLLPLLLAAGLVFVIAQTSPAAAQSTKPAPVCFEITPGWRICAPPVAAAAERAAAQSTGPVAACFEITAGWRICVFPGAAPAERTPAQPPGPCATGRAVPDAANNPGLVADCTALLAAKAALAGTATLNWDADQAIKAWDGVTLGGTPPRVTALDLAGWWLRGTIPPSLGDLSQLRRLYLQHTRLSGTIPPELGDLARLEELALSQNRLTGTIPPELGNLARLELLYLSANELSGPIPVELGDLGELRYLYLHLNRLTGQIPSALGNLDHLAHVWLAQNRLTGCLPRELTQVPLNDLDQLSLAPCDLRFTPVPSPAAPPTAGSVEPPTPPPPPPCRIVECIEPAPGAVERKIWELGETMDEDDYFPILFWSVHTWVTEGYRPVTPLYSPRAGWYPISLDDRWVLFEWLTMGGRNFWIDDEPFTLLLDRESGRTWRWPGDLLWARALSGEHILFQEHPDGEQAQPGNTHFALVTPSLDVVARFATAIGDPPAAVDLRDIRTALVAPDGGTVALLVEIGAGTTGRLPDRVQLVDVATGDTTLFFEPEPREGYYAWVGISEWRDGQQFAVTTTYSHRDWKQPRIVQMKIFDWAGTELVDGSCPGRLSPDGRHVAQQEGFPVWVKHVGFVQPVQPWASVVIADATSCEPILRVRSAYTIQSGWAGNWLSTGEGYVVGVAPHPETGRDFALVRVRPSPALIDLPPSPVPPPYYSYHRLGPWFAPFGGDRYFARPHVGVYDARLQRWMRPVNEDLWPDGWTSKGEVVQMASPYDPYEGGLVWLLVQPRLEFPPFSEDLSFRVVGAGACVELRRASGDSACLADGTPVTYAGGERVTFTDGESTDQDGGLAGNLNGLSLWVRTDEGVEGWIRTEHLAWR